MAKVFSVSASYFIDKNARSRESAELAEMAEMAANMATQDVLQAMDSALTALCPHKSVCALRGTRVGCSRKDCSYLGEYYAHIRSLGTLTLPK